MGDKNKPLKTTNKCMCNTRCGTLEDQRANHWQVATTQPKFNKYKKKTM
jgi:hypothetical protein